MRVLVDTCGWIEWLTDGPLAGLFEPYFNNLAELVVPTSLQFELYKWAKREKGEKMALEAVALTDQGVIAALNSPLAIFAADLALAHRLSFADAIIYATAVQYRATLVTADDHFEGLPGVIYFPKRTA